MEAKHTPEPWQAVGGEVVSATGAILLRAYREPQRSNTIPAVERDENIRRTVACVNGCEGIADPSAVSDMLDALHVAFNCLPLNTAASNVIRAAIARAEGRR